MTNRNAKLAHLHVHTDASLRDGLGVVPRLVGRAKEMGFRHLAMTDHGTLANAISFSIEAQEAGIKPLIGLEGYVAFDGQIGHITLLADGMVGWHSLLELNNKAHLSLYRQPAFEIDDLVTNAEGLVCLTGCIASPFHQLGLTEAKRLVYRLREGFGNRLFAELMFAGDTSAWERPLRLASMTGLKPVVTNDVHFPYQSDGSVHSILTRMKSGFDYDSSELYLKSYDQLLEAAIRHGISKPEATEMLDRTGRIGDLLGEVTLKEDPHLPKIGMDSEHFLDMLSERPRWRSGVDDDEYAERVAHELDVIAEMDYLDYFVILDDIIQEAKKRGVKVGPGRGSGAGSLILYILGITDVDPLEHGLQFERFLNPERRGMPDVDVDIDSEGRDLVLDYTRDKYGAVPIAT